MNIAPAPLPRPSSLRVHPEDTPKRFTIDGDPGLECQLASLCAEAGETIKQLLPPNALEGMLLGGGYGRGEGGVLRTPEGDRPYNDLEFYVFVKGPWWMAEGRYQAPLHHRAEQMSAQAGLDLEFKTTSLAKLRHSQPSMFYYDLLWGHHWITGEEQLLQGCDHLRDARQIPVVEAVRLLMNRCSGLLFAKEHLRREVFTSAEADFVQRNIAKAELALGDAVLTLHGQYHWSCLDRNRRLRALVEGLACLPELQHLHDRGVQFKLHPFRTAASRRELLDRWDRISHTALTVFLWLESKRLGTSFPNPLAYSKWQRNKAPEVPGWRALLVNTRARRWSRKIFRYPRDRVLTALPLLLWCWDNSPDSEILSILRSELQCASSEFGKLVECYKNLWSLVN